MNHTRNSPSVFTFLLFFFCAFFGTRVRSFAQISMATGFYQGTGLDNEIISGVGFQPDVVIIKVSDRDNEAQIRTSTMPAGYSKQMVGGSALYLSRIKSFTADGFMLGNNNDVNAVGKTYYWTAFRSNASLKTGSFTGDGTDGRDITGIGFQPDVVFLIPSESNRSTFRTNTFPAGKCSAFGSDFNLSNTIEGFVADGFTVGDDARGNKNGAIFHYVAFKASPGSLKTGSYEGDGVNNRIISGVGFKADYMIVKSSGSNYATQKSDRMPDSASIEFSGSRADDNRLRGLFSDGFAVGTQAQVNSSSHTYHYICFKSTVCTQTLSISKIVEGSVPENDWSFASNIPGHATFTIPKEGGSVNFNGIPAGTYSITETNLDIPLTSPSRQYSASNTCGSGTSASVTVNACAAAGCVFTNSCLAKLTISNILHTANPLLIPSADWEYSVTPAINGESSFTIPAAGGNKVFTNVPLGVSYVITQVIKSDPTCLPSGVYSTINSIGSGNSASITLNDCRDTVISFTNTPPVCERCALQVNVNSPSRCSNGEAVAISASPSPAGTYDYSWTVPTGVSNPGNVSSFNATTAGTYTVTVTDNAFCSVTASGTLTVNSAPTVSVNSPARCSNGEVVTIIATPDPAGTYNYSWTVPAGVSNPGNVSSLPASTAGIYSVIITDGNSCSGIGSGTLTVNNVPTVTVNSPARCSNGGAATITASPDPVGTYNYSWTVSAGVSNPGNVTSFSATAVGTYKVFVTDGNSCVGSGSGTLTVNSAPAVTVNSPARCSNGGAVTIIASPNPAGTYNYSWTVPSGVSNPGNTASFSATVAGTYSVTITDGNSCSGSGSGTLTVNNAPTVLVNSPERCSNGGAVTITASPNPAGTYNYSWTVPTGVSNPGNTASFSATAAGTYGVTITDGNSCSGSGSGTLFVNPVLTVTCSVNNLAQTLTAVPSGGTGPYGYSWNTSPVQTTQTITVTNESLYTVVVTDSKGCQATSSCSSNTCNGIFTVSQGGWGATPKGNNPAQYLKRNFSAIFPAPDYLTAGCSTGNKIRLTSARAVEDFLPSGSTPRLLPAGTLVNPGANYSNVFAGLVVALTINVKADLFDAGLSSSANNLRDLIVNSGTFAGWTVGQILNEANKLLGGCPSAYSINEMNNIVDRINNNYELGQVNGGILSCPGTYPLAFASRGIPVSPTEEAEGVTVFPNPFGESTRIRFRATEDCNKAKVEVINSVGLQVAILFEGKVNKGQYYITTMNMPQLPSGLYYYRIISDNKTLSGKILKAR